jgi:hypothetical protein
MSQSALPKAPSRKRTADDTPEDTLVLARASLDILIFLFEILMALAITDGAMLFLFGNPTSVLQDTFDPLGIGLFIAFVLSSLRFAHGSLMYMQRKYRSDLHRNDAQPGFTQKRLQPLLDFFFLFIQAGTLYLVSHTFAQLIEPYTQFFVLMAIFFAIDVVWCLVIWPLDPQRTELLEFAALNSATIVVGLLFTWLFVSIGRDTWLPAIFLGILLVRGTVDYWRSYQYLFPGAFSKSSPPPAAEDL